MDKIIFKIELEEYEPKDKTNICLGCVLARGFNCMDRSYCHLQETGKVWKISKQIRNKPPKVEVK